MTRQYPLPLPYREAMEVDDFMVTDSNREAMGWIDKWPQWPSHCLVIYGPAGSGKTHLMNVWLAKSNGKQVTPDELTTATLENFGPDMRAHYDHLAIDNADSITGDAVKEEVLFHLYNRGRDSKGFLLLTAEQAPAQWGTHGGENSGIQLPDLKSRLLSVPAIAIKAPDDVLLTALLIKQFRDRQIDIGTDVVGYLLPRMTRTPDAIRKMVADLDRASLAEGRRITVALVKSVLSF